MKKAKVLFLTLTLLLFTIFLPAFIPQGTAFASSGLQLVEPQASQSGAGGSTSQGRSPRLIDEADLLSGFEEEALIERLDDISERHQTDVVIATVNGTGGQDGVAFTDDFFDAHGFGMGAEENGIILLIDMYESEVFLNGCGNTSESFAHKAFTDYGREQILDEVFNYLQAGDFNGAFHKYADMCDDYMTRTENGEVVDIFIPDEPEKKKGTSPIAYLLSLLGGFGGATASAAGQKKKLKTVRFNYGAANYAALSNLALSRNNDTFLNINTRRTPIVKASSNSGRTGGGGHYGGTTTHHSSSGRVHSSSHRKF